MKKDIMIVDGKYSDIAEKNWGERFLIVPSATLSALPHPVDSHPDMALFEAGDKTFICAPAAAEEYLKKLSGYGIRIIPGEKNPKRNYPDDIAYNVMTAENYAFAAFSHTDTKILRYLKANGILAVNIKQGYAKCSSCVFGKNIITADKGIYKASFMRGFNALLIKPGGVSLPGYEYGFIGGASGVYKKEREIFFFGDPRLHENGEEILDFIGKSGWHISCIAGQKLIDTGTLIFA